PIAVEVDDNQYDKSQHECDSDITGNVGCTRKNRNQPQEVIDPDEKENRQQKRHEPCVSMADVGPRDVVTYEKDYRLDERLETLGRLSLPFFVSTGHGRENQHQ